MAEVRQLRKEYEGLVARIDEALEAERPRASRADTAADGDPDVRLRGILVSMAAGGVPREEAESVLLELPDTPSKHELFEEVYGPPDQPRKKRLRFRRRGDNELSPQ